MNDCIFCKIIRKELTSDFLYEDQHCIVINDLYPKAKTHLLIIPKKHIESIMTLEDDDQLTMGHLINTAKNIAKKIKLKGYKLQINVGKDGGQEIFHLHIHLLSNFS